MQISPYLGDAMSLSHAQTITLCPKSLKCLKSAIVAAEVELTALPYTCGLMLSLPTPSHYTDYLHVYLICMLKTPQVFLSL